MKASHKRVLAAAAVCLLVLGLVVATAALMLAGEADAGGNGRSTEERMVALGALVLAACALSCWGVYRLDALYAGAPLRMAEELKATLAHSGLRLAEQGASELRLLAQAANQLLDVREARENDVAERIREARASLEEERSRLAALMADLSQSVVVCNLDGRVLLYNQRAKQELSAGPDGRNAELLGLGRSIYTVFDRALIGHALERLELSRALRARGTPGRDRSERGAGARPSRRDGRGRSRAEPSSRGRRDLRGGAGQARSARRDHCGARCVAARGARRRDSFAHVFQRR